MFFDQRVRTVSLEFFLLLLLPLPLNQTSLDELVINLHQSFVSLV